MISRSDIIAWRKIAPWQANEQVEQDLVICRSLVEIFSDEFLQQHLAFRGGTALHKLYLHPQVRYSEDIDLVQTKPGAIGEIFDRLRNRLAFLGKPVRRQRHRNNALIYKFKSEIPPSMPLKLKVEINCREHFTVFGFDHKNFYVTSRWFSGECKIMTYSLEELLGSKLRALYQRKQGRDLFDLWYALTKRDIEINKVIKSYQSFMEHVGAHVSRNQFQNNLENKMKDMDFLSDLTGLLRMEQDYNIGTAFTLVSEQLISRI
jgi:predicted nucleotidyltransferase component of viral defense system